MWDGSMMTLQERTRTDFDNSSLSQVSGDKQRAVAAMHIAYEPVLRRVTHSLQRGVSVLLRTDPAQSDIFSTAIEDMSHRQLNFLYPEARNTEMVMSGHSNALTNADKALVRDLQEQLTYTGQNNVILLDFVNILWMGDATQRALFLYVLQRNPHLTYLAILPPSMPIPPSLASFFPVIIDLPYLAQHDIWNLFALDELQSLMGVSTLTVEQQRQLFAVLGGCDAGRIRDIIAQMKQRVTSPLPVAEAIMWLSQALGFIPYKASGILSTKASPRDVAQARDYLSNPNQSCVINTIINTGNSLFSNALSYGASIANQLSIRLVAKTLEQAQKLTRQTLFPAPTVLVIPDDSISQDLQHKYQHLIFPDDPIIQIRY